MSFSYGLWCEQEGADVILATFFGVVIVYFFVMLAMAFNISINLWLRHDLFSIVVCLFDKVSGKEAEWLVFWDYIGSVDHVRYAVLLDWLKLKWYNSIIKKWVEYVLLQLTMLLKIC